MTSTTYLIGVGRPTRFRGKYDWHNMWRSKFPYPRTLEALHPFMLELIETWMCSRPYCRYYGRSIELPAVFGLTRTHGKREGKGFKGVLIFRVTEANLELIKGFAGIRGIPGAHNYSDFEWKQKPGFGHIKVDIEYQERVDSTAPPDDGADLGYEEAEYVEALDTTTPWPVGKMPSYESFEGI